VGSVEMLLGALPVVAGKLISYANLAAMDSGGVTFVAPASKTYVPAAQLAGHPPEG
jgi:hypothetical protein